MNADPTPISIFIHFFLSDLRFICVHDTPSLTILIQFAEFKFVDWKQFGNS